MNKVLSLAVFCLFGLLASCIVKTYVPEACRATCNQRAEICKSTCRNNCAQCRAFANQWAAAEYADYAHEKYIEGAMVARVLKSYRDPLQCRKITCSCKADYQICIQACSGVIQKKLKAAPAC